MKSESLSFRSDGKRLYGNLHLPTDVNPPCVICLHGLESSKDGRKWPILASAFSEAGFACLRFSFRGCGQENEKSEGDFEDTSLTSRIEDYEAALRFLQETEKVDMKRLGTIGSSFGGMVAIAAQNTRMKAIVTLATPTTLPKPTGSLDRKGYYALPSGRTLKGTFFHDLQKYNLLEAARNAPPILIVHGKEDNLVPVEHARRLYRFAKEPKALITIEGADHTFSQAKHLGTVVNLSLSWFKRYFIES